MYLSVCFVISPSSYNVILLRLHGPTTTNLLTLYMITTAGGAGADICSDFFTLSKTLLFKVSCLQVSPFAEVDT